MALNLTSPNLPTAYEPETVYDPNTVALRGWMDAVYPYPPTTPPVYHIYNGQYDTGVGDDQYNVGYKQLPVANEFIPTLMSYEAPDVPVTHLPFKQQLYNTTLVQRTVDHQVVYSLRAPGINEGY